MGFFDFLDARRGIARWADKWFRTLKAKDPSSSNLEIARMSLSLRYQSLANDMTKIYVSQRVEDVSDIFDLCYLVADAECHRLLSPGGRLELMLPEHRDHAYNQSYRIIDEELTKLGYRKRA